MFISQFLLQSIMHPICNLLWIGEFSHLVNLLNTKISIDNMGLSYGFIKYIFTKIVINYKIHHPLVVFMNLRNGLKFSMTSISYCHQACFVVASCVNLKGYVVAELGTRTFY